MHRLNTIHPAAEDVASRMSHSLETLRRNTKRRFEVKTANKTQLWKRVASISVLVLVGFAMAALEFTTESWAATVTSSTFASPAEAGAALVKAAQTGDEAALSQILGADASPLLFTGNKQEDSAALAAFAAKYEKMNRWVAMSDGTQVLYLGADNFAFPFPLTQDSSGRWHFDSVAGAQEIRARDIGGNELLAIAACYALADAERTYFLMNNGAPAYTQRIISTSGQQDGLYWTVKADQDLSPLAALDNLPKGSLRSVAAGQSFVVDGYSFRILTAQGANAPGGFRSYLTNGKLTGGFAVLASPVKYGETGVMSFMLGLDGAAYERDLGPDTTKLAGAIQVYDPNQSWSPVD